MTETEATARLRSLVDSFDYKTVTNNYLKNRNMRISQNQFDALISIQYNSGRAGKLLDNIIKVNKKYDKINRSKAIMDVFVNFEIIYPGLQKKRNAEAKMYIWGEYDKNFEY